MKRKIQSTTSPESEGLIREFLYEHYSGVLATSDAAANPHAAVVYYVPSQDLTLNFVTKSETQKYKNIEENEQVAFVIYDEDRQTTLQITGHVEIITDDKERQSAINNMSITSAKLSLTVSPPAEKLLAGNYVVLRLIPQVLKMAIYARPDSQGDDLYETLILEDVR